MVLRPLVGGLLVRSTNRDLTRFGGCCSTLAVSRLSGAYGFVTLNSAGLYEVIPSNPQACSGRRQNLPTYLRAAIGCPELAIAGLAAINEAMFHPLPVAEGTYHGLTQTNKA